MADTDPRHFPHTHQEYVWAQCRPAADRTPIPREGDEVLYRHHTGEQPTPATVVWVQPLDDIADPNLVRTQMDPATGEPMLLEGRYVLLMAKDPWPLLILTTVHGRVETREARLRGSPGWLPLDWETRYRPAPDFVIVPS